MKIGIFDPYLNTLGGGEKYMLSLALCLSKKNDVEIFWNTDKEQEIKSIAQKRFGFDLRDINFVKNIFSPNVSLLERCKKAQGYDVIIYLSDGSIPLTGKKNLVIHFQFPLEWVKPSIWTRIKFLQVKNIICNSQFTKSYIDKKFDVQSVVVYPPVTLHSNVRAKKENIILHVGRFGVSNEGINYKKQDVMIDVFKRLVRQEKISGWKFVLIISFRKEDEGRINDFKKRTAGFPIQIIENPSNEVLWEMYTKAKIYWHATGVGEDLMLHPERAEHFGIATAEAMGTGAVPVVINAGGQREIVRNDEDGFLWNTEDEFIAKTKQLMTDTVLWKRLSKNATERAKVFGSERFNEEIEKLVTK